MILHKGSASGTPVYCVPLGIDLSSIEEGTDYAGFIGANIGTAANVEIYDEDGPNETKCVSFRMLTSDGLQAVGSIGTATDLVPQMGLIEESQGNFVQNLPFEAVSGAEPDDWELHRQDWYYGSSVTRSSGGNTATLYPTLTTSTEVWSSPKNKNTEYCSLFWTESGGVFGAGMQIASSDTTNIMIAATAGARYGSQPTPPSPYPQNNTMWHPRFYGIDGTDMFPTTFANNKRMEAGQQYQHSIFSEFTAKVRIVLCSFMYDSEEYFGCAVLRFGSDDTLQYCGCWGISAKWWQSPQSKYNYTVNPDGSVNKAVNPNYVKPNDHWGTSTLPADGINRIVTGANYLHKVNGIPYGYATYALTNGDFQTCIAEWSNALAGYVQANSSWYGRLKTGIASGVQGLMTAALSDPIESILKVHTLPIASASIRRASTPSLTYVRSGGLDSSISAAGIQVHNDGRIVELTGSTNRISRMTGNFSDWTGTNVTIFLPCLGEYPLKSEYVIDHYIYVDYRIDIISGQCNAVVRNERENILTVSGNLSIPVVCSSSASIEERALHSIGSAISSAVSIAAAGSTGNALGVTSAVVSGAGQMLNSLERDVTYSSMGGASGLFSGLYDPQVLVYRQMPSSGDLTGLHGYLSGSVCTVEELKPENGKAFVSVQSINIEIPGISPDEAAELERLMKGGVYL